MPIILSYMQRDTLRALFAAREAVPFEGQDQCSDPASWPNAIQRRIDGLFVDTATGWIGAPRARQLLDLLIANNDRDLDLDHFLAVVLDYPRVHVGIEQGEPVRVFGDLSQARRWAANSSSQQRAIRSFDFIPAQES